MNDFHHKQLNMYKSMEKNPHSKHQKYEINVEIADESNYMPAKNR